MLQFVSSFKPKYYYFTQTYQIYYLLNPYFSIKILKNHVKKYLSHVWHYGFFINGEETTKMCLNMIKWPLTLTWPI